MKKVLSLLAVFALTACLGGMTPPSKFYSLTPIQHSQEVFKSVQLNIGVEEVKVPVYLDRPQIVTRHDNQVELNVSELNRWSEPLSTAMQRIIADNLAVYLPNASVKPSGFRHEGFDYLVWIEINRFDGSWDKTVDLSVWWSVFDKNGDTVLQKKANLSRPLGQSYDDLVKEDSDLVSELSLRIAQNLARLKK